MDFSGFQGLDVFENMGWETGIESSPERKYNNLQEQRMTSKDMKNNTKQANRAQMERKGCV